MEESPRQALQLFVDSIIITQARRAASLEVQQQPVGLRHHLGASLATAGGFVKESEHVIARDWLTGASCVHLVWEICFLDLLFLHVFGLSTDLRAQLQGRPHTSTGLLSQLEITMATVSRFEKTTTARCVEGLIRPVAHDAARHQGRQPSWGNTYHYGAQEEARQAHGPVLEVQRWRCTSVLALSDLYLFL